MNIEALLASVFAEHFRDMRSVLMVSPTEHYATRDVAIINRLIVHHTAVRSDVGWPAVARYHVESNGWPGIAYHFGVEPDGVVSYLGDVATIRYHARQANTTGIGICCAGDYATVTPAPAMIESLGVLLNALETWLGRPQERVGHRDVVDTTCPGDMLYALIPQGGPVGHEPLPQDEPVASSTILANKVRWWLEEYARQTEAGQVERANAILYGLIDRDDGLLYRLERQLEE